MQNSKILFVLAISYASFSFNQIDVFENNCLELNEDVFNNASNEIRSGCIETPLNENNLLKPNSESKDIIASKQIVFNPNVTIEPNGAHSVNAYIEDNMEIVAYVDDLNNVEKLAKFEIGIKPSELILEQIDNFLNDNSGNKINPYLSREIRIYTVFKYQLYYPPIIVVDDVYRDAFYYKEVERDISGFDDLENHPSFNTSQPVGNELYKALGGGWNVQTSDYPFRVRFAPEVDGPWSGQVFISLDNGSELISGPEFFFEVVPSNNKGYLKVGRTKRFLTRDGKTHFTNGINLPFIMRNGYPLGPRSDGNTIISQPEDYAITPPIAVYEQGLRHIDTLAMHGVNHFRLIMAPWCSEIEWEELGNYSSRQHIAKELDLIIEKAEEHDILINWNLSLHFRFSENLFGGKWWDWTVGNNGPDDIGDPYNRELNLNDIEDFFSNSDALFYWKERLRYIVARWGYSTNIAMFELLSEIDQVGKKVDDNGDEIQEPTYYDDPALYMEWQLYMARYLKDELKIPQLLTASYTTKFSDDHENEDFSYHSPYFDVASINNYNFYKELVHGFHKDKVKKYVAHEDDDLDNNYYWLTRYDKPVFFSESGATELWYCDNHIETRRNIWQNAFWGVSGSLDWEIEQLHKHPDATTQVWSIYKRVAEFFEGVDLDGENWHSGMTEIKSNGSILEYNKSYRDDAIRKDELADVVYLRSGDRQKAFGVITNRRANYYTLGVGDCADGSIPKPEHSKYDPEIENPYHLHTFQMQLYGQITPAHSGDNRLRLRNMGTILQEFKIKYYSPYDLVNSIKEETRWGPQLTLEFPTMGGKDSLDVILFEVFRMGESFKSMQADTTNSEEMTSREPKKEKEDEVIVYPSPNDGNFVVLIESPDYVKAIYISDNLGKRIESISTVSNKNTFSKTMLSSGVYIVEVVFEKRVVRKKVIIN